MNARTAPTSAPTTTISGDSRETAARRLVSPSWWRLYSPPGGARSAGASLLHGPDGSAGPDGVDEHRLGAALEVGERVEPGRAGVERVDASAAQAPEHVEPEPVVAVPGVAEADDAHRAAHQNVNSPAPASRDVDGADEAGVVRAHDVEQLDRVVEVGDLQADEALLPVTAAARAVARGAVPGGGRDHLVVRDRAVPDPDPVAEAAARGVDRAEPVAVRLGLGRDERGLVEVGAELARRSPASPRASPPAGAGG